MYKFTTMEWDMKNVPIDLRDDAHKLIEEFGINILYIRNCKFVRCRCFDDLHKTGDPNCPLCMGTGYFASIQKIKAFESSNSAYSSTNSIVQTKVGTTDQKNEVYYIEYKYTPKTRDFILKVTWDAKGNPIDVLQVLEIVNVYEMRGDKGRLEVTGCLINDRTDLMVPYNKALKGLSKKGLGELLRGGKYIWPSNFLTTTPMNAQH